MSRTTQRPWPAAYSFDPILAAIAGDDARFEKWVAVLDDDAQDPAGNHYCFFGR